MYFQIGILKEAFPFISSLFLFLAYIVFFSFSTSQLLKTFTLFSKLPKIQVPLTNDNIFVLGLEAEMVSSFILIKLKKCSVNGDSKLGEDGHRVRIF